MRFPNLTKVVHSLALAFTVIMSSSPAVFAQAVTAPLKTSSTETRRVASLEGINEYRLPNGLKVLLFPDQAKQNITVNIVYLVGSRHENYGETGMAHLLEHLVFKGTPKHLNIPAELTAHGATPNGTTSFDRTNYFETFAPTEENLEWALDMEADRMVNSFIAEKDLKSEFSVVRNEMESGENSPLRILLQRVMASAYEWHNYGKNVIGARSDVENVPIDRLQAFYKKHYQPDNAVLIVAGKFDEAKTLNLIDQKFGAIPKPIRELPKNYTVEPVQDGERQVTLRRVGNTQFVMAGYHVPPGSHPDYPAVSIMGRILTDTPSGRLYKSLVASKKATGIFNFDFVLKEPGYLIFAAEVGKNSQIESARNALEQTIDNFAATAPAKEEVERFKAADLKNMELSFNDPNFMALQLTGWVAQGDWRLLFLYRDGIKKVTPEDVRRAAQNYLKQSNRTLGLFVPTPKPERAEIPAISDSDIAERIKNYKSETGTVAASAVAEGENFEPTYANIEARTKRSGIGGLKVAFLPKENRGDTVSARLTLHFGTLKSLANRAMAGRFAGQMLIRGTTGKTRQQIKDEFDRLKAVVRVTGNATGADATIETTRRNLPEVLKLVAEILRQPAFSQAEFDQLKQERLTDLESDRSEPLSVASRALGNYFDPYQKGDVRYFPTRDEEIADIRALTLRDVKKFHKDFYGASNGELAIVGDFDIQSIAPLVSQLFGAWKSPKVYQRITYKYVDIPAANKSFETPDKANAAFLAQMVIKMRNDNPDYPALALGNFMLGGGFLNSRLATRLRQKEGLSYNVGSTFSANPLDELAYFSATAIYAPQNAGRLETAFKEEINRVVTEGFTADEVEQAKKGWLLSRQNGRGQDTALAGGLAALLFIDRTFAWPEATDKKVMALTPAQINAAMKKYIAPDKITIFKAGDFAKSKPPTER